MGLFDTNIINSATVSKGGTAVKAAQTSNSTLVPSAAKSTISGLSSGLGTVTSTVGKTIGSVGGVVSTTLGGATGAVGSVANGATGLIGTAENAIGSTIGSFLTSVDKTASGAVSSLFSDTTSKSATNPKDTIPDATASNFGRKSTPNSKLFGVNKLNSATAPVNFKNDKSTSTLGLSNILGGGVLKDTATLVTRLGTSVVSTVSDVENLAGTAVSSVVGGLVGGMYSDLKSSGITSTVKDLTGAVNSTVQGAESLVASGMGLVNQVAGLANFQSLVGGLASSLTGETTGLNGFYRSDLSGLTGSNGTTVDTAAISADQMTQISSLMKSIGCSKDYENFSSVNTNLSIWSMLAAIAGRLGITSLLQTMLDCGIAGTAAASSTSRNLFQNLVGTDPSSANIILNSLGPNGVGMNQTLAQLAVSNPGANNSGTISAIQSILGKSGYTTSSVYGTGQTINGQPVYNSNTVSSSTPTLLNSLFGNTNMSRLVSPSNTAVGTDSNFRLNMLKASGLK